MCTYVMGQKHVLGSVHLKLTDTYFYLITRLQIADKWQIRTNGPISNQTITGLMYVWLNRNSTKGATVALVVGVYDNTVLYYNINIFTLSQLPDVTMKFNYINICTYSFVKPTEYSD